MEQTNPSGPLRIYRAPINSAEAARYLGVRESYVRRLVLERRIPFLKLGPGKRALVRFLPDDLDRWVQSVRVEVGT